MDDKKILNYSKALVYRALNEAISKGNKTSISIIDPALIIDKTAKKVLQAAQSLSREGHDIDHSNICERSGMDFVELIEAQGSYESDGLMPEDMTKILDNYTKYKHSTDVIAEYSQHASPSNPIQPHIQKVVKELSSLLCSKANTTITAGKGFSEVMSSVEYKIANPGKTGIPTGFSGIDEAIGGFQKGHLVVIGARTGMGKTALSLRVTLNMALENRPVAFFSHEMPVSEVYERMSSMLSGIPLLRFITGKLSESDIRLWNTKTAKAQEAPLYVDSAKGINSIEELLNRIAKYVYNYNVEVVTIDYLQLLTRLAGFKGNYTEESALADISRALKNIAKELDICIILLSQLNRASEYRGGEKIPTMSDLRGSGQIEEAADLIFFIHRPEYYKIFQDENGNSTIGKASLILGKGRNVAQGSIMVGFDGPTLNFYPL